MARTYDIPLRDGFEQAQKQIASALYSDVCNRIGGDVQRVTSIDTEYGALTYKHLLLPVWMLTYKYKDKPFQVLVNAASGEVQGQRPYSWIKITLFVLLILLAIALVGILMS